MLKTISAALLAVSVIAAPALAETAVKTAPAPVSKTSQAPPNKTTQAPVIKADQTKSKVMNANAHMGAPQALSPSSPPQAHGCVQDARHRQGRGQARPSGRQARLKPIRRRGPTNPTLPPPRPRVSASPRAIASPMAVGWCCVPIEMTETRIPFRRRAVYDDRRLGFGRFALGDISKIRGDPAAAGRARGMREQRRRQVDHLYRRSRRLRPALSEKLPHRGRGVHAHLSKQSGRGP